MNLIQCSEDCVFQKDGYCDLELPFSVNNYSGKGCIHCIRVKVKNAKENKVFIPGRELHTPPVRF